MKKFIKAWQGSPVFREIAATSIALCISAFDLLLAILLAVFGVSYKIIVLLFVCSLVHFCCAGFISPD